jgi:MinD superfamily P-loop ATPase
VYIPVIDKEKCSLCRQCTRICPKKVFRDTEEEVEVDFPTRCTGCESCSAVCPLNALTVKEM